MTKKLAAFAAGYLEGFLGAWGERASCPHCRRARTAGPRLQPPASRAADIVKGMKGKPPNPAALVASKIMMDKRIVEAEIKSSLPGAEGRMHTGVLLNAQQVG